MIFATIAAYNRHIGLFSPQIRVCVHCRKVIEGDKFVMHLGTSMGLDCAVSTGVVTGLGVETNPKRWGGHKTSDPVAPVLL